MALIPNDPLVTTEWVAANLADPTLRLVDASWWFPHESRDGAAEFETGHLPGAVFFDIDAIADLDSPLPHMLPPPDRFAEMVGRLGLGDEATIIVYETGAPRSAPRAWWSLRAMGHQAVRVLDGGLQAWRREGRAVALGAADPSPAVFTPHFNPSRVRTLDDMRRLVEDPSVQIADARPAPRFNGSAPEPREGLRSGHMPGAFSLPASDFYNADGTMKSPAVLRQVLSDAGVDPSRPIVASCGSGITACTIALALARLGQEAAVYDGSWAEWGSLTSTPVVTGP